MTREFDTVVEGALRNFMRAGTAATVLGAASLMTPPGRSAAQTIARHVMPADTRTTPQEIQGGTFMEQLTRYIQRNEGMRRRQYLDSKGHPTIGIGHLIQPGEVFNEPLSDAEIYALFRVDVQKHIRRTKDLITGFDNYPNYLKVALVDGVFRGDLSGSPKTLSLIREGKWHEASREYLRNNEYRDSKRRGRRHGVWQRMERNASLMFAYGEELNKND